MKFTRSGLLARKRQRFNRLFPSNPLQGARSMVVTKTKTRSKSQKKLTEERQTSAREQFIESQKGAPLHGEIITWEVPPGTVKHLDVVNALRDAGLDEKVARELLPRH